MSKFKIVAIVALSFFLFSLGLHAFSDDDAESRRGGREGVKEFFASGTFTVPSAVTHVMLTMWGAGGGGGASYGSFPACQEGGLGGGGAYTNTVVRVAPNATYNVVVGVGGIGGVNPGDNGADGGDSQFELGNRVLAFAGGGTGGVGGTPSGPGIGGNGGQADSTAQISHSPVGPNKPGGGGNSLAYAYNLAPDLRNAGILPAPLGTGGPGGVPSGGIGSPATCNGGTNGMPGYVLLTF